MCKMVAENVHEIIDIEEALFAHDISNNKEICLSAL